MWAGSYFAARYFAPRYWAKTGADNVTGADIGRPPHMHIYRYKHHH